MHIHISLPSWASLPPLTPALYVITEYLGELPTLYSKFPLAVLHMHECMWSRLRRVWLSAALKGLLPSRCLCPWDSPGKNTGVGCSNLLQGIFPTQGLNPGLLLLPALAGEFFTTSVTWKAHFIHNRVYMSGLLPQSTPPSLPLLYPRVHSLTSLHCDFSLYEQLEDMTRFPSPSSWTESRGLFSFPISKGFSFSGEGHKWSVVSWKNSNII